MLRIITLNDVQPSRFHPLTRRPPRARRASVSTNSPNPSAALGRIEELAERLAAIHGDLPPIYERRAILVGAGDHGVTAEGVSAYPSEVTPQMVGAFLGGFAAISAFSRVARAEVFVANFGVAAAMPPHERLFDLAIARGTRNFAREAAMDDSQLDAALAAGARAFAMIDERTSIRRCWRWVRWASATRPAPRSSSGAFTGLPADDVVGRGTGVDDETYRRKVARR